MTHENIIELGWINRHKKTKQSLQTFFYKTEYGGKWIMAIFKPETNGLHQTTIKFVDDEVNHNEWENSECHFYGYLKTKEDLIMIMRFVGIIEY